jgi:hypothetical protein
MPSSHEILIRLSAVDNKWSCVATAWPRARRDMTPWMHYVVAFFLFCHGFVYVGLVLIGAFAVPAAFDR